MVIVTVIHIIFWFSSLPSWPNTLNYLLPPCTPRKPADTWILWTETPFSFLMPLAGASVHLCLHRRICHSECVYRSTCTPRSCMQLILFISLISSTVTYSKNDWINHQAVTLFWPISSPLWLHGKLWLGELNKIQVSSLNFQKHAGLRKVWQVTQSLETYVHISSKGGQHV